MWSLPSFPRPARHREPHAPQATGERDYRSTPPMYAGAVQLLDWASTARSGMVAKLELKDVGPKSLHPLKGLACGASSGQRLHVVISKQEVGGQDAETDFAGEALLLAWSDDCFAGMSVKLLLGEQAGEMPHPLQHRTAGRKGGDLLLLTMWAVDDDENLQRPEHVRRRRSFGTLSPIQQSQLLSRTPDFQRWLAESFEEQVAPEDQPRLARGDRPAEAFAADMVRYLCGVSSRAELGEESDRGEAARLLWRRMIARYEDWKWGRRA